MARRIYHDYVSIQFTERKIPAFAGQNYRLTELRRRCRGPDRKIHVDRQNPRSEKTSPDVLQGQAGISFSPLGSERDLESASCSTLRLLIKQHFWKGHYSRGHTGPENLRFAGARSACLRELGVSYAEAGSLGRSLPWDQAFYKGSVEYRPDICPKTLDLLGAGCSDPAQSADYR